MSGAAATAPVELRAVGVTRIAGRRHLVRDITLAMAGGEVVALVGRNGAGKTTLLSILAGRVRPDRGAAEVRRDGRVLDRAQAAAAVGFLPHDLFLYPDLTGRENLAFFATLHGVPDPAGRSAAALGRIGLARDGDRPVRTYSRGMQQRAAIGRLLVTDAAAWLLDEPTTGLDEPGRRWLADVIREQAGAGRLVVMATHHRAEVAEAATRVVVLDGGRVALDAAGGTDGASAAFARLEGTPG